MHQFRSHSNHPQSHLIARLLASSVIAACAATSASAQCSQSIPIIAPEAGDHWGHAVAISADGSTALVGAPYADLPGLINIGAVRVVVRSGDTWVQQTTLMPEFAVQSGAQFGWSVALSADGNTAAVGMRNNTIGISFAGSVRIFVRNTLTQAWTQQAILTGSQPVGSSFFGTAVSLSDDGNTLLASQIGKAFIYTRTGDAWNTGVLLPAFPAPAVDGQYGRSAALSPDGQFAVVGEPTRVNGPLSRGAVYVFRKAARAWVHDAFLTRSVTNLSVIGDLPSFGHAVDIDSAGDDATLVVGDPDNSELKLPNLFPCEPDPPGLCPVQLAGCVYMYGRSGGAWAQLRRLFAPDVEFPVIDDPNDPPQLDIADYFGYAVSLRGTQLIVGAPGDESTSSGSETSDNGSIYRFTNGRGGAKLTHPDNFPPDKYGWSVAMAQGGTYIAGAPEGDDPAVDGSGTADIMGETLSYPVVGVDPDRSVFTITITFPDNDPPPQTLTFHMTGRLFTIITEDCDGDASVLGIDNYDAITSIEQSFTVALPGGNSATYGPISVTASDAGHAAVLDAQGMGGLRGYSISIGTTQLSSSLAGLPCTPPCLVDVKGNCDCNFFTVLVWVCSVIWGQGIPSGLAGDGPSLSISDLDFSSMIDFGLGANNPTVHITGDINLPLPCPGNVNNDNAVNVTDLLGVISAWGDCGDCTPGQCPADIAPSTPDCAVNVTDLLAVISNWGACP